MNRDYRNIAYLRRYLDGQLTTLEMYELERAAHHDEMLMDTLLGMEFERSREFPLDINELHQRVQARIEAKSLPKVFPWAKWAVAASVFLIAVAGAVYWIQSDNPEINQTAMQEPTQSSQSLPDTAEQKEDTQIAMVDADHPRANDEDNLSAGIAEDKPVQSIASTRKGSDDKNAFTSETADAHARIMANQPEMDSIGHGRPTMQELAYTDIEASRLASAYGSNGVDPAMRSVNSVKMKPQTQMILDSALDKRSLENAQSLASLEDKLVEIKTSAAANNLMTKNSQLSSMTADVQPVDNGAYFVLRGHLEHTAGQSTPVGGWKALDEHLYRKIRQQGLRGGYAQYKFRLDTNGKPRDIQIVKTSDTTLNSFLIQLVQEGPAWQLGSDAAAVQLDVIF